MARIRNTIKEVSIPNMSIGSSCWVDITYINNPHSFYVRPRAYGVHMPYLQARGEKIHPSQIRVGDVHIFKSRMLRCYARGKIVEIEDDHEPLYKLLAIDYGCIEVDVSIHRIWHLYHKANVPGLVTHCQLADCMPLGNTWSSDAIEAMKDFMEGERAKIIIRSKAPGIVAVELHNSCPDDISTLLTLTGYTTFEYVYNSPMEYPMLLQHYNMPRGLHVNVPMQVRMTSGTFPENFYVVLVEEYQVYMQDRNDFRHYAQNQISRRLQDLRIGAPVAVYYLAQNEYERGIVKELHPVTQTVRVKLVDIGTEVVEDIGRIKAVPEWYLRIPARAIYCTVHRGRFLETDRLEQFTNPHGEFVVTIDELGPAHGPHVVTVSRIIS
ncbi:uncharacterized protein [Epargyreus clarus]|uniref:uncharacterized protein n=1 Tax=Epargyreus clarus TaxID=520877 RepID=UPI003C3002BD